MKKLLIATHNKAKLQELLHGTKHLIKSGIHILSLHDLSITANPEETGKTFFDNAVLKAVFYGNLTGLPVIADDGGIIIKKLNNEPGIKSKRWLGHDASDNELVLYTLKRLKGVPPEKRTAYLQTSLCYFNPEHMLTIVETGQIEGYIATRQSNHPINGYPYRSLFIVRRLNKYYDELTRKEHNGINHRLDALKRLSGKIKADLIQ